MNIELLTDILIPKQEEVDNILKKIELNQELDIFDYITLRKLKLCNLIIKSRGEKI